MSISAGATPGEVAVEARPAGRDARTSAPLSAAGASTFTILSPARLEVAAVTLPGTVRGGGWFVLAVAVRNAGQVGANLKPVTPSVLDETKTDRTFEYDVQPRGTNAASVEPNQQVTLLFDVTPAVTAHAGASTLAVTVAGTDAASGASLTAGGQAGFRVLGPASLAISNVRLPEALAANQQFEVAVTVANTGETDATLSPGLLSFARGLEDAGLDFQVRPRSTNPTRVESQTGAELVFDVTAAAAPEGGMVTVLATVTGVDDVTRAPLSASGEASTLVRVPALVLQDGQAPELTGQGETFELTLRVTNPGQTVVTVDSIGFGVTSGSADFSAQYALTADPANVTVLQPNASAILRVGVGVAAGAAPSKFETEARVTGHEAGGTRKLEDRLFGTLQVLRASALVLEQVDAPTTALPGASFDVTLTVANPGDGPVSIASGSLLFGGAAASGLSVTQQPRWPVTVTGRGRATRVFGARSTAGTTGAVTIDGSLAGTDKRTNAPRTATASKRTARVTIQAPPPGASVLLPQVQAPATATQNQSFRVTVTACNPGGQTATGLTVRPTFAIGGRDAASGFAVSPAAANPTQLAPGAQATFAFTVLPSVSGTVSIDASASGKDQAGGSPLAAVGAASGAAVTVIAPFVQKAVLSVVSLEVPGSVERGQAEASG